jgi:hypothetical protein
VVVGGKDITIFKSKEVNKPKNYAKG